jgi:hypothetical protein
MSVVGTNLFAKCGQVLAVDQEKMLRKAGEDAIRERNFGMVVPENQIALVRGIPGLNDRKVPVSPRQFRQHLTAEAIEFPVLRTKLDVHGGAITW